MSTLTPLGSARTRFLVAAGVAPERDDEPPFRAPDADDFEPAYLGWELARCARGAAPGDLVGLAALAAACIASMRAGSTRMPLDARLEAALLLAGAAGALPAARAVVERARAGAATDPIAKVIGLPGQRKPLVVDGTWLYAERMRLLEERFSARVGERLTRSTKVRDARALGRAIAAIASGPPPLTDEQKRAVREALGAPLALVTGGPGTGKTTIVVALLRALAWLGNRMESIAIAAPTGKAAQRLRESIAEGLASAPHDLGELALKETPPAPQTLHRLLGWSPQSGRFARHENDPLVERTIVVDEASMIDLAMMDRLMRALREDARLVLLGDADQLPSVEAGAVFRDLCAGLGAVRLTVNLRVAEEPSARPIVAVAQAINTGTLGGHLAGAMTTRRSVDDLTFEGVEHLTVPWESVGDSVLDAWWQRRFASLDAFAERVSRAFRAPGGMLNPAEYDDVRSLLGMYGRARILCATRVMGPSTSTDAINEQMLARLRGRTAPRWRRGIERTPGTPIVVDRNDYERQLFNGDQGIVLRADACDGGGIRPMIFFRRGETFEAFSADTAGDLSDVTTGFAMTVHKAQGSEFDDVLLVLPETDLPLLTRELIYTAVTRARRSVLIVGDPDLLARAVSRVVERHCGIAEKLRAKHS